MWVASRPLFLPTALASVTPGGILTAQRKEDTRMRTAFGYVRVSSEEQAESGLGLEAQRQRVRAYCEMKGLGLAAVYEDPGVSGGKPLGSRPAGKRPPADAPSRPRRSMRRPPGPPLPAPAAARPAQRPLTRPDGAPT